MWPVYFNLLFLLKLVLSATTVPAIIDPKIISAEVKKYFDKEGIEKPSSKEKTVARKLIYEREEHRQRADYEHDRAQSAEKDREIEVAKRNARDIVLGYRSRIEKLESLLYPDWLMNTKLTRQQRLLLAFSLHTTKYAPIIQDRMQKAGLSPYELASFMNQFYDNLSIRYNHYQKIKYPQSEEEWKEVYEFLGVTDEHEKKALKITLEPLPHPEEEEQSQVKRYFILLANVDFKATELDVQKLFQTVDDKGTARIQMITKYQGKASGYVAVDFIGSNEKQLTASVIQDTLLKYKKSPFNRKEFSANVYNIYTESEKAEDIITGNDRTPDETSRVGGQ